MNFISTFDELNKLYENASSEALHEGYTVKYGRGGNSVNFDNLDDAVKHINDGMQKRSQTSYVLYQDGTELIWLDWYSANRDGSDSNWSEARKATKAPVSFDKKEGKLSVIEEALTEGDDYWRDRPYYDQSQKDKGVIRGYQPPANYKGSQSDWENKCRDSQEMNKNLRRNPWEDLEEPVDSDNLTEAAEDEEVEIVDDEMPKEEEPRQVIMECTKCGALVIKEEADIVVDEESDLVNVEDECQFCEEADGFKIIGVVVPYEAAAEAIEEPVEEEPVEESLHNSELLKEIEKTNELKTEHESEHLTLNEEADEEAEDIIDEDLADVFRKKFDRPASVTTQQWWEAELTDLQLELEHETDERKKAKIEKRIKQLEDKFLQQRDWEARHAKKDDADELEELLDLNVPVNVTANGNDVAVGGMT